MCNSGFLILNNKSELHLLIKKTAAQMFTSEVIMNIITIKKLTHVIFKF